MRLLLLTAQYHPAQSPNVYRWQAIAEYWVQQGHTVEVLCTRRSGNPEEERINGVQVYRIGHLTLLDWGYSLLEKKQKRGAAGGLSPNRYSRGRRLMEWIVDHTWRKLYWPDGSCLWYMPGKRKLLQLLKGKPYDAIISVGLPFTAHLIALAGIRKHPNLRWLVDIEDPFAISEEFFVNNFALYRNLNFQMERKVLQQANAVSFTVSAAQQAYEEAFPECADKFAVTPPLFHLPAPANAKQASFTLFDQQKIHLAYFGTFYTGVRSPDAFLYLLRASLKKYPNLQEQLTVHFFGEIIGHFAQTFADFPDLQDMIHLHGLVDRATVAKAMAATDILLNISNSTAYHLPSKCADYLMSRKPILNIYSHPEDTFKSFFEHYPLILNLNIPAANTISPQHCQSLYTFFKTMPGQMVAPALVARLGAPYQLKPIADQYLALLNSD